MKLLVTTAHPSLHQHQHPASVRPDGIHPNLGRLIQPRHTSSIELTELAGIPWAADNDCFQGLNVAQFTAMLERLAPIAGSDAEQARRASNCHFVTVPDVVGDALETAKQFERWESSVRRRGLPAALVAQDGLEDLDRWLTFAWPRIDALFIGGSTEWKLGPAAATLAREAQRRGKWVHWGRVNTKRRYDYIAGAGLGDSFDGSKFARWRKTYLDVGLAWTEAHTQPPLIEPDFDYSVFAAA